MKGILFCVAAMATVAMAGGKTVQTGSSGSLSKKLDTNGYRYVTNYCKEEQVSGTLMIKNKNLDEDRNGVFFKSQRITYVVPDSYSKGRKRCWHEVSTGINELDMKKLLKKLD